MIKEISKPHFYPSFIILLPFLFFIIGNFHDLNFRQLTIVLTCSVILIVLSYVMSLFLSRHLFKPLKIYFTKNNLFLFFSISIFILFNYRIIEVSKIVYILIILFLPIITAVIVKKFHQLNQIISITSLSMVIVCAIQIGILSVKYSQTGENLNIEKQIIFSKEGIDRLPNIYLFTLDAYSREDQLKNLGYDNSYFIKFLEESNFFVGKESRSNFLSTFLSMYTLWSMQYPNIEDGKIDINLRTARDAILGKSIVTDLLRDLDYMHIRMGPNQAQLQDCSDKIDLCLFKLNDVDGMAAGSGRNIYFQILLMTPMDYLLNFINPYILDRNIFLKSNIGNAYKAFIEKKHSFSEPFLLEANVWQPHGPYILDENCNTIDYNLTKNIWSKEDDSIDKYLDETQCVNKQLIEFVNYINKYDSEAIIIISSDHGHAFYTDFQLPLEEWKKKSINGRSSILLAIKAGKECSGNAYKDISPVNIFRLVFACLNNSQPQFLEDMHYIHHEKFSELLLIE